MTFDPDLKFFSLFILVNTNSQKYSFLAMYSYTYTPISLIKYKAVIYYWLIKSLLYFIYNFHEAELNIRDQTLNTEQHTTVSTLSIGKWVKVSACHTPT